MWEVHIQGRQKKKTVLICYIYIRKKNPLAAYEIIFLSSQAA